MQRWVYQKVYPTRLRRLRPGYRWMGLGWKAWKAWRSSGTSDAPARLQREIDIGFSVLALGHLSGWVEFQGTEVDYEVVRREGGLRRRRARRGGMPLAKVLVTLSLILDADQAGATEVRVSTIP